MVNEEAARRQLGAAALRRLGLRADRHHHRAQPRRLLQGQQHGVQSGRLREARRRSNAAYDAGRCDAYTTDQSGLYSIRLTLANPDDHVVLPEIISKEPLGPVVRQGDDQWFDIVKWTHFALLNRRGARHHPGQCRRDEDLRQSGDQAPARPGSRHQSAPISASATTGSSTSSRPSAITARSSSATSAPARRSRSPAASTPCGRRAACSTRRRSADRFGRQAGRRVCRLPAHRLEGSLDGVQETIRARASPRRALVHQRSAGPRDRLPGRRLRRPRRLRLVDRQQHDREPAARQHRLRLRLPERTRRLRRRPEPDRLLVRTRPSAAPCWSACSTRCSSPSSGIVTASILGFLVGIGRLSRNWLIRKICDGLCRDVPQHPAAAVIFFWYRGVLSVLPGAARQLPSAVRLLSEQSRLLPAASLDLPTATGFAWLRRGLAGRCGSSIAVIWPSRSLVRRAARAPAPDGDRAAVPGLLDVAGADRRPAAAGLLRRRHAADLRFPEASTLQPRRRLPRSSRNSWRSIWRCPSTRRRSSPRSCAPASSASARARPRRPLRSACARARPCASSSCRRRCASSSRR